MFCSNLDFGHIQTSSHVSRKPNQGLLNRVAHCKRCQQSQFEYCSHLLQVTGSLASLSARQMGSYASGSFPKRRFSQKAHQHRLFLRQQTAKVVLASRWLGTCCLSNSVCYTIVCWDDRDREHYDDNNIVDEIPCLFRLKTGEDTATERLDDPVVWMWPKVLQHQLLHIDDFSSSEPDMNIITCRRFLASARACIKKRPNVEKRPKLEEQHIFPLAWSTYDDSFGKPERRGTIISLFATRQGYKISAD